MRFDLYTILNQYGDIIAYDDLLEVIITFNDGATFNLWQADGQFWTNTGVRTYSDASETPEGKVRAAIFASKWIDELQGEYDDESLDEAYSE